MIVLKPSDYGVDESKAEFKTFVHAGINADGEEFADLYDYDGLKALCRELKDGARVFSKVMAGIAEDDRCHVSFGTLGDADYFEIQWD